LGNINYAFNNFGSLLTSCNLLECVSNRNRPAEDQDSEFDFYWYATGWEPWTVL